ncbi:hypothetical protein NDU88_008848 [Pleurodeles waltl]|uniref:Uncharacterized protein n=1 Tax=Pleurodeles waltl TaxID=8319 RepID=A0AAV7PSR9_PLEWA|nr:hypothetical protein NDU88_008848 [Pleurodeles waltl]
MQGPLSRPAVCHFSPTNRGSAANAITRPGNQLVDRFSAGLSVTRFSCQACEDLGGHKTAPVAIALPLDGRKAIRQTPWMAMSAKINGS